MLKLLSSRFFPAFRQECEFYPGYLSQWSSYCHINIFHKMLPVNRILTLKCESLIYPLHAHLKTKTWNEACSLLHMLVHIHLLKRFLINTVPLAPLFDPLPLFSAEQQHVPTVRGAPSHWPHSYPCLSMSRDDVFYPSHPAVKEGTVFRLVQLGQCLETLNWR